MSAGGFARFPNRENLSFPQSCADVRVCVRTRQAPVTNRAVLGLAHGANDRGPQGSAGERDKHPVVAHGRGGWRERQKYGDERVLRKGAERHGVLRSGWPVRQADSAVENTESSAKNAAFLIADAI